MCTSISTDDTPCIRSDFYNHDYVPTSMDGQGIQREDAEEDEH